MKITIFQNHQLLFATDRVVSITLSLVDTGQVTILDHHIPIVGEVTPGKIVVKMSQTQKQFSTGSGLFYFADNVAKIIVQ